tara:strand:- start:433 stop:723 length:291 start_codon:yes stop_codon:yes gene_type:complete
MMPNRGSFGQDLLMQLVLLSTRHMYARYIPVSAAFSLPLLFLSRSAVRVCSAGLPEAAEWSQIVFWNFLIAFIDLVTLIASAALPLAALRQWLGRW